MTRLPRAVEIDSSHASLDYGTRDNHESRLMRYYWRDFPEPFAGLIGMSLAQTIDIVDGWVVATPRVQITRIRLVGGLL
jgi:hypothetical protein